MASPALVSKEAASEQGLQSLLTFSLGGHSRVFADEMQVVGNEGVVIYRRNGDAVGFVNQSGCVITLDEAASREFGPEIRVWLLWTPSGRHHRFQAECLHPDGTGFATLRANGKPVAFVTPAGIVGGIENHHPPPAC